MDDCKQSTFEDDIKSPYVLIHLITEANMRDYKRDGAERVEKFIRHCELLGNSNYFFVFCPVLEGVMKKLKGLESKLLEVYNDIIIDVENHFGVKRDRFLKLFD